MPTSVLDSMLSTFFNEKVSDTIVSITVCDSLSFLSVTVCDALSFLSVTVCDAVSVTVCDAVSVTVCEFCYVCDGPLLRTSVTSVLSHFQCVRHVCDASFLNMSATSVGGGGSKFLPYILQYFF